MKCIIVLLYIYIHTHTHTHIHVHSHTHTHTHIYICIYYLAGITEPSRESLDAMIPDTKEEFERFATILSQKINQFNKHAEFPTFAEELIKSISLQCKHVF